jgi:hypothetical protein
MKHLIEDLEKKSPMCGPMLTALGNAVPTHLLIGSFRFKKLGRLGDVAAELDFAGAYGCWPALVAT